MVSRIVSFYIFACTLALMSACTPVPNAQQQVAYVERTTGLTPLDLGAPEGALLGKTHREYPVLVRIHMGEVWGRLGARMAMAEAGDELGGIWRFLTGSYSALGAHPVGSPMDRLLSDVIGQPISILVVLRHQKQGAPRLDVVSDFSTIKPYDRLPKADYVSFGAGSIYSYEQDLVRRLVAKKALMNRLGLFRSEYIRLDDTAVTFAFAGSENDYSAMIRDSGSYDKMLNNIMDSLADIADEL